MFKFNISIITVCKNSEKTIGDTVNSVANLINKKHIEYIIQDSLSNDSTLEIVSRYRDKLPNLKIFSEKDYGLYDGMNKAIDNSHGKYLLFLNSDDILLKNFNEFFFELTKSKSIDYFYAPVVFFNRPNFEIKRIFLPKNQDNPLQSFIFSKLPPHPGFVCKADILKKNKFEMKYNIAADYNQILKIIKNKNYKSKHFKMPLIAMAKGGKSNTFSGFKTAMNEMIQINKKEGFKEKLIVRYTRNLLQHIFPIILNKQLNLPEILIELRKYEKNFYMSKK